MINYNKKSLQYIFNRVAKHLITQNKHSKNKDMMDEDGNRCALGCLIPKREYPEHRYCTWGIDKLLFSINSERRDLLHDLQLIHDSTEKSQVRSWPRMLREISVKYNLEIPTFIRSK